MLYKDLLTNFKKSEFNGKLYKLLVADEVDYFIQVNRNLELTKSDYEIICEFVAYVWMSNVKVTINEIVDNIFICLNDKSFTIDDLKEDLHGTSEKCRNKLNRMF